MASNLSTIGFVFDEDDAFAASMSRLAAAASERMSSPAGEYAIWRSKTGAQIWFHLAPSKDNGKSQREIVGFSPFFEGSSEVALKVTKAVRRPDDNAHEGAFYGWVGPDETGEGSYPLVFDAVDFAAQADRELPAVLRARLVGFARELTGFPSEDAFHDSQKEQPSLAARAFIPMGLFAKAADDSPQTAEIPSSSALFTGCVKDHRSLVNEETGRTFHWLSVETLDATYDILADPDVVKGEIVTGGTIETACWFFGRLLD